MSAIVEFIKGQDPVMLILLGMGLILILPVALKQVASVVGKVVGSIPKKKPSEPDSITPQDGPSIEEVVKQWSDLYKVCHRAGLYDACDKLDEAWVLLRKKDKNGE